MTYGGLVLTLVLTHQQDAAEEFLPVSEFFLQAIGSNMAALFRNWQVREIPHPAYGFLGRGGAGLSRQQEPSGRFPGSLLCPLIGQASFL